jgi:hypothetical protein
MVKSIFSVNPFLEVKNSSKRSIFIFDHGLGDFINFLPVHEEFQRQTNVNVSIASAKARQFDVIYPGVLDLDSISPRVFGFIYKIIYPDTKVSNVPIELYDEPNKPYLCAYYELKMNRFVWKPFKIKVKKPIVKSKRIGVSFFGHTGFNEKFCSLPIAKQIWKEIIEAGFCPFECHMRPDFRSRYNDCGNDECPFIGENETIRYKKPDMKIMMDTIGSCCYFIGVDAGPLYLAASILGHENVIGLENKKKIAYYSPKHVVTVSIKEYQPGVIYQHLKLMEGKNNV